MKKIIAIISLIVFLLLVFVFFIFEKNNQIEKKEQQILEKTYNISKKYLALRYQTDLVLFEAEKYENYNDWNSSIDILLVKWQELDEESLILIDLLNDFFEPDQISLGVSSVSALEKSEISAIFDSAPAGKKIVTLAKHLGVDAKKAMAILRQDQDQVTADAWNEAGDTFQKLETSATLIKDGCKVAGFVGGIAITGGVSAIATGSMLAKATIVVSGADLVLEVSDDASKIALGNHNKVSAIINDVRKVTEPVATILSINEIPDNLASGYQKFNSVMIGLEQFNSAAQEGKIVGVELPSYEKQERFANIKKHKAPIYVSVLSNEEDLNIFVKDQNGSSGEVSSDDLLDFLNKPNFKDSNFNEVSSDNLQKDISNNVEDNSKDDNAKNIDVVLENEEEGSENEIVGGQLEEESGDLLLTLKMKPVEASNDWQATIKNSLFANAPINITGDKFVSTYSDSFSVGSFQGSGQIKIEGTFDQKTRIISGKHYRKYDGLYKDEPRTIVYYGNFSQTIPEKGEELKINFSGTVETTILNGSGKPYTTENEAGVSIVYVVQ